MELIVGSWGSAHTGPADRKTPLRVGTLEQHANAARVLLAACSEVRSLVRIDL
jgi:hypothetical protein